MLSAHLDWRSELNRAAEASAVRNCRGQPIVFAEAGAAGDEPYEAYIARTGQVPTRSNLHDFFNALMFLQFPRAKARLNQLQSEAIDRHGIQPARGAVRDAATLIDENGVLLVTRSVDLIEAVRRHDWSTVFLRRRAAWNQDGVARVFGHALLQKLVRPYKSVTAHALHVPLAPDAPTAEVDDSLASMFDEGLSPLLLMPLPVLGIPGWCAKNANPDFYRDAKVFRPANMLRPRTGEAIE